MPEIRSAEKSLSKGDILKQGETPAVAGWVIDKSANYPDGFQMWRREEKALIYDSETNEILDVF